MFKLLISMGCRVLRMLVLNFFCFGLLCCFCFVFVFCPRKVYFWGQLDLREEERNQILSDLWRPINSEPVRMEPATCPGESVDSATPEIRSDNHSPKEVEIVGMPFKKAIDLKPRVGGREIISDLSPEVPTVHNIILMY